MAAFYLDPDRGLRRADILGLATWSHPLTWALQVMPLFFYVGGYSHLTAWQRAQARGERLRRFVWKRIKALAVPATSDSATTRRFSSPCDRRNTKLAAWPITPVRPGWSPLPR